MIPAHTHSLIYVGSRTRKRMARQLAKATNRRSPRLPRLNLPSLRTIVVYALLLVLAFCPLL
jgi:hypothetical protein